MTADTKISKYADNRMAQDDCGIWKGSITRMVNKEITMEASLDDRLQTAKEIAAHVWDARDMIERLSSIFCPMDERELKRAIGSLEAAMMYIAPVINDLERKERRREDMALGHMTDGQFMQSMMRRLFG